MARRELYVSVDVESDGPIPGPYSLLSFGMAACGTREGADFTAADPTSRTFFAELKPISDSYDLQALAVGGLDREALMREGRDPGEAMTAAAAWVTEVADGATPVLVAYPLGFDWMWLYWYLVWFSDASSPFGHSRHLDMKTLYATKANVPIGQSTKRQMPAALLSRRPHTHNALADAIEQAEPFCNPVAWAGMGE